MTKTKSATGKDFVNRLLPHDYPATHPPDYAGPPGPPPCAPRWGGLPLGMEGLDPALE